QALRSTRFGAPTLRGQVLARRDHASPLRDFSGSRSLPSHEGGRFMRFGMALARLAVAGTLVLAASPLFAWTWRIEKGDTFNAPFELPQPASLPGGIRLAPGRYDVHFLGMMDGSVRANFFSANGREVAHGIIAVVKISPESQAALKLHEGATLKFAVLG